MNKQKTIYTNNSNKTNMPQDLDFTKTYIFEVNNIKNNVVFEKTDIITKELVKLIGISSCVVPELQDNEEFSREKFYHDFLKITSYYNILFKIIDKEMFNISLIHTIPDIYHIDFIFHREKFLELLKNYKHMYKFEIYPIINTYENFIIRISPAVDAKISKIYYKNWKFINTLHGVKKFINY